MEANPRTRRGRAFSAAFGLALGLLSAALARAEPPQRVILATRDAELQRALEEALAAWNVDVLGLEAGEPMPAASMPRAAERGRALADDHGAAAVAWISMNEEGPALWTYDRESDRVQSRRLPSGPPFDEATAAAIALSIKTFLRHSTVAPPGERFELDPRKTASVMRLEISGGVRAFATAPADVEPRGAIVLALWPDPTLGMSLGARTGSGVGVTTPVLAGRWITVDLFLGVRSRWAAAPWLDLGFGAELGASLEVLDATLLRDRRSVSSADVDPVLAVAAEIGARPADALRLGLRLGGQAITRTRTYAVSGQPVLATEPVRPVVEVSVEVPLDGGTVVTR